MQKERLGMEGVSLSLGGRRLFENLNWTVNAGELCGVAGQSGSGKTSLLRLILGFLPLEEGRIFVDSLPMSAESVKMVRARVAYVPQELSFPCETVTELIRLPFELKANRAKPYDEAKMMEEWERVGLNDSLLNLSVSKLSGGQRQRIMLVSALMLEKPLILLDEPTSALDETTAALVIKRLKDECERGCAVITVTHDARLLAVCDKKLEIGEKVEPLKELPPEQPQQKGTKKKELLQSGSLF